MNVSKAPYEGLDSGAFWRSGVVEQGSNSFNGLYRKKFEINRETKVATAGSCFAQHIARHLRARKFSVLDFEPAPSYLTDGQAKQFGYGLYSARYANIYTVQQFKQLVFEAPGLFSPADAIWERDGRYFDAMRPSVESEGLESPEEVKAHRAGHLSAVRQMLRTADVIVFTLGLTEARVHESSGTVYPTAPGTIAGQFDPDIYKFANFNAGEAYNSFLAARRRIKQKNPNVRFLLTVSPVPLTATASGQHVLAATTYSKSVLRAVAGQLYTEFDDVDYFSSYEIIATPVSGGRYFKSNLREVRDEGVENVMKVFFSQHGEQIDEAEQQLPDLADEASRTSNQAVDIDDDDGEDVVCEDVLLDAFSRR